MYTHWCVLIEISMEIGMFNFWLGLLVTALMKETYFRYLFLCRSRFTYLKGAYWIALVGLFEFHFFFREPCYLLIEKMHQCAVLYLFDLISISFSESHAKWLLCSSEVFSACWQHFDKSLWYKIVPRCDKILPATRIFRTRKSNARPQFTLRDFYTRKRNCAAFERCQGGYGETKFSIRIK